MKIHEFLKDHPERWTKDAFAREANGQPTTSVTEKWAVCWCAAGLISRQFADRVKYFTALNKFKEVVGCDSVTVWNDDPSRTFSEVYKAFRKADL